MKIELDVGTHILDFDITVIRYDAGEPINFCDDGEPEEVTFTSSPECPAEYEDLLKEEVLKEFR